MTGPKSIAQLVAEARQERDAAIAQAEDADVTGWDRKVIDQAITAFADRAQKFSANSMRELLPDVRPALIGARFLAAANAGLIRKVGLVTSTKANTHAKPVALWVGTTPAVAPSPPTDSGPTLFDDVALDLGLEAS